jgi:hypothetical protein
MPFGDFINKVPNAAFIVIHIVLALLGLVLWRKASAARNAPAARGFLLFVVAEILYLTYHFDVTTFLFAHTVAEVCDALAFLSLSMGLGAPAGSMPPRM